MRKRLRAFTIPKESPLIGQLLTNINAADPSVSIWEVIRFGKSIHKLPENFILQADDVIVLFGTPESLAVIEDLISY